MWDKRSDLLSHYKWFWGLSPALSQAEIWYNVREMDTRSHTILAAMAVFAATTAFALNVVFDDRTPESHRTWADESFVREQMEAIAPKICKALYDGSSQTNKHKGFTIILYPAPVSGGNPAFASGRRITWKVGASPKGDASGGMGCLCHEMTHVLDMGSDGVFTEAMADWVRNYKVWYPRCTSPSRVLDIRHKALCGSRNYGKYMSGANFVDFMTQNYGEGTILRILEGYAKGKNPWERLFGKDLDALVSEWKTMQTIYDGAVQWSYVGSENWLVRKNGSLAKVPRGWFAAKESPTRSGATPSGRSEVELVGAWGEERTFMLHGRFGAAKGRAVASIGGGGGGRGKVVILSTVSARSLALSVVARTGQSEKCVATSPVPLPEGDTPHSVVVVVRGDVAVALVDGKGAAKLDFRGKCDGCPLGRHFAVGGVAEGLLGSALKGDFGDASDSCGIVLDDVRVFNRAARSREVAEYARVFGTSFAPAAAVAASWTGGTGGDVSSPGNWYCVNSAGERITATPTKETAVTVFGRKLPSIPPGSRFECKSFTVDGWAVAEAAIDWRGVNIVDCTDGTKLMSKGGMFAVRKLRGADLQIGGHTVPGRLAVEAGARLDGKLTVKGGSLLRLPDNGENFRVRSLELAGEGQVFLKPGTTAMKPGERRTIMRAENLPGDLSRLSLFAGKGQDAAGKFEASPSGDSLTAIRLR